MMLYTCNSMSWEEEVETGGSEVQSHPQLHIKLETILCHMRPSLKTKCPPLQTLRAENPTDRAPFGDGPLCSSIKSEGIEADCALALAARDETLPVSHFLIFYHNFAKNNKKRSKAWNAH